MKEQCPEIMIKVVELATLLGIQNINQLPGAWEYTLDEKWTIAINGHNHEVIVKPVGKMEATIQPYNMVVWRNGWLAGIISPFEGVMLGQSTEDDLIAALGRALADAPAGTPTGGCAD